MNKRVLYGTAWLLTMAGVPFVAAAKPAAPAKMAAKKASAAMGQPSTLEQLRVGFLADREHYRQQAKPGDNAIAQIESLLGKGKTFQSPELKPLANTAHASYQRALPHLWAARIKAVVALMLAQDKRNEVETDLNKVNDFLNQTALYDRDLWKIMHGWAEMVPETERSAKETEIKDLVVQEMSGVDKDRAMGQQIMDQMAALIKKERDAYRIPEVAMLASNADDTYGRVRAGLWRARIELQVVISYYAPSKEDIAKVPQGLQDRYTAINLLLEHAGIMQAMAQSTLHMKDKDEWLTVINKLRTRREQVEEQFKKLMGAANS